MAQAKYIKFGDRYGNEYIVIFPDSIVHFDMARKMGDAAISAGFVVIDVDGNPVCYGESTSLNLQSEPEDTAIVKKMFNLD